MHTHPAKDSGERARAAALSGAVASAPPAANANRYALGQGGFLSNILGAK